MKVEVDNRSSSSRTQRFSARKEQTPQQAGQANGEMVKLVSIVEGIQQKQQELEEQSKKMVDFMQKLSNQLDLIGKQISDKELSVSDLE